ncbi:MAG: FecR family protein [Saprospiraceae bacterium]
MNKIEFKDLLKRYLSNNCSDRERLLVEGWYDLLGDKQDLDIDNLTALEEKLWHSVSTKTILLQTEENLETTARQFQLTPWYQRPELRVAASWLLLIVAGFGWLYFHSETNDILDNEKIVFQSTIQNTTKKPINAWLEDSSKIVLYPGSQLNIPLAFANNDNRIVYLKGEAIFDVTRNPNKPFLVYTGEVVTRVLGTSFRITHTGKKQDIEVAVLSGKVSVYNKNVEKNKQKRNNGVVLTPNQKVTYHSKNKHFVTSVVDNPVLLKKAKTKKITPTFIYEETSVSTVIEDLEDNYGIQIIMANERFNDCPLTANLANQSLFNKLEMICTPLNATFDVKGTTILINGRGCN